MENISKQIKQLLFVTMLVLWIVPAFAQPRHQKSPVKHATLSDQLQDFILLTGHANITFNPPKNFREIRAPDDEDFSFDYAMELPGKDFEIWFQVKSEKQDWFTYIHNPKTPNATLANPDSLYIGNGEAQAIAFTGDKNYFVRILPQEVLARNNADAGRSYLLTLLDLPQTKHYKYALMISLQKNHIGSILMVYFTNDKGPEFFKNLDLASYCLKFNP